MLQYTTNKENACSSVFNENKSTGVTLIMPRTTDKSVKSRYLDLLAEQFNNKEELATEIINLESILELPKGTEHFVSDLHGEFNHSNTFSETVQAMLDQKLMTSSKIH